MNNIKHKSGKTELQRRICPKCDIYYPTLKALKTHSAICVNVVHVDRDDEDLELDQGDSDTE